MRKKYRTKIWKSGGLDTRGINKNKQFIDEELDHLFVFYRASASVPFRFVRYILNQQRDVSVNCIQNISAKNFFPEIF